MDTCLDGQNKKFWSPIFRKVMYLLNVVQTPASFITRFIKKKKKFPTKILISEQTFFFEKIILLKISHALLLWNVNHSARSSNTLDVLLFILFLFYLLLFALSGLVKHFLYCSCRSPRTKSRTSSERDKSLEHVTHCWINLWGSPFFSPFAVHNARLKLITYRFTFFFISITNDPGEDARYHR